MLFQIKLLGPTKQKSVKQRAKVMLIIKRTKQLERSITSKVTLTSVREVAKIEKVTTRDVDQVKMLHKFNNVKVLKTIDVFKLILLQQAQPKIAHTSVKFFAIPVPIDSKLSKLIIIHFSD